MKKLPKKFMSKVASRCVKFVTAFVVMIASILFVACGKSSGAAASDLDAYGKYRLNPVTQVINYTRTSEGLYNEYTGSFLVPMEFYADVLLDPQVDNAYNAEVAEGEISTDPENVPIDLSDHLTLNKHSQFPYH